MSAGEPPGVSAQTAFWRQYENCPCGLGSWCSCKRPAAVRVVSRPAKVGPSRAIRGPVVPVAVELVP